MYVNSCIPIIRHWAYGWGSEENGFYGQNTVGILLQYFLNPQEGAMGHSFVNHPTSKIFWPHAQTQYFEHQSIPRLSCLFLFNLP